MTSKLTTVLDERGLRYGRFTGHAKISMDLKTIIAVALFDRGKALADDQTEALHMICHKIARIINGNSGYIDNFRDIAGYATLVADRLQDTDGATDTETKRIVRVNGEWVNEP